MTQAIDIIRDALGHLRVLDADANVLPEDARDALGALNKMMRTWEADGITLGWSDVSTIDDNLPTPPEADEALGYNLAVRLRARYGASVDPDVVGFAASGVTLLRTLMAANDYARLSYDDLPTGNSQHPGSGWRAGFYR